MELIVADWESYYDKDFSLSKLTMEEYIRSPLFECIMLGLRMPDGTKRVITGTHAEIKYQLDQIEWGKYAVVCHNTLFDAAIFTWIFDIKPRLWIDTMGMARAMFGGKGNSLKSLAERYNLIEKGTYVANMMGRRRESLSPEEFQEYAEYCLHDCELTYDLWTFMSQGWYSVDPWDNRGPFPKEELRLIDKIIRMYTEPALFLNVPKLQEHYNNVVAKKAELIAAAGGVAKEGLLSNNKFADILISYGIDPPTKISPKTGKKAFAFAKTDAGIKELLEHPNIEVQALVAARLGIKSTIEETRSLRFIEIGSRGIFPVPLRYGAARTHRLAGCDRTNLQNLGARGKQAGKIKEAIEAPDGYVIIDCDSSNIEARGLAWLAEQYDLVEDFANGVDVYCKMATRIYGFEVTKANKPQRFCGKTVVLGAGYQTGGVKLQNTLRVADPPMLLSEEECHGIIRTYRATYAKIPALWKQADKAIQAMHDDTTMWLGREGALWVDGRKGIRGPNGLYLQYPQLHKDKDGQWAYKSDFGLTNIYGGKLVENCLGAQTEVLTHNGWKRILDVSLVDKVWDGDSWVGHRGLLAKGFAETIDLGGVKVTPDHKILVNNTWVEAKNVSYKEATSSFDRSYRIPTRWTRGNKLRWEQWQEVSMEHSMRLWERTNPRYKVCAGMPILWLQEERDNWISEYTPWNVSTPRLLGMAINAGQMSFTYSPILEKLWGSWNYGLRAVGENFRSILGRHGEYISTWIGDRQKRQQCWVLQRELPLDDKNKQCQEQAEQPYSRFSSWTKNCSRTFKNQWYRCEHTSISDRFRMESARPIPSSKLDYKSEAVYDLMDCGKNRRFTVRGSDGRPFLVHNCTQHLARCIVMTQLLLITKRYKVVLTVHDAVACIAEEAEAEEAREYVEACMRVVPEWAKGWPLNCESGVGNNYGEC